MDTDALKNVPPEELAVSFHTMAVESNPCPWNVMFGLVRGINTFSLQLMQELATLLDINKWLILACSYSNLLVNAGVDPDNCSLWVQHCNRIHGRLNCGEIATPVQINTKVRSSVGVWWRYVWGEEVTNVEHSLLVIARIMAVVMVRLGNVGATETKLPSKKINDIGRGINVLKLEDLG